MLSGVEPLFSEIILVLRFGVVVLKGQLWKGDILQYALKLEVLR